MHKISEILKIVCLIYLHELLFAFRWYFLFRIVYWSLLVYNADLICFQKGLMLLTYLMLYDWNFGVIFLQIFENLGEIIINDPRLANFATGVIMTAFLLSTWICHYSWMYVVLLWCTTLLAIVIRQNVRSLLLENQSLYHSITKNNTPNKLVLTLFKLLGTRTVFNLFPCNRGKGSISGRAS